MLSSHLSPGDLGSWDSGCREALRGKAAAAARKMIDMVEFLADWQTGCACARPRKAKGCHRAGIISFNFKLIIFCPHDWAVATGLRNGSTQEKSQWACSSTRRFLYCGGSPCLLTMTA